MNKKQYDLMNWEEIESVIYADCDIPFSVLGINKKKKEKLLQVFYPDAEKIVVNYKAAGKKVSKELELVDEVGFYCLFIQEIDNDDYTLDVYFDDKEYIGIKDPYSFKCTEDSKLYKEFFKGYMSNAYDVFGSRVMKVNGVAGTLFSVYAPGALRVSVVGDFNEWDGRVCPMQKVTSEGNFMLFIPGLTEGYKYNYELKLKGESVIRKIDPFSFVCDSNYSYTSKELPNVKYTKSADSKAKLNILELDVRSFLVEKKASTYIDVDAIIGFTKDNLYNAVKILPVLAHDNSDKDIYHTISMFGFDKALISPADFKALVEKLHENNIKVFIDINLAYFSKDNKGLNCFDGSALFEHQDVRMGFHPYFDAKLYQYANSTVTSYLYSCVAYYVDKFNIDGFSFVNVSSMLYLDYNKSLGEWIPNLSGGNENTEAINFIKNLVKNLRKNYPGLVLTAYIDAYWPHVTDDTKETLGFDYVVNTGFVGDWLHYLQADPTFRSGSYEELTRHTDYAYNEKFIVGYSYFENHKDFASILRRMPGNEYEKVANARLCQAFKSFYPGAQSDLYDFVTLSDENIGAEYKKKYSAFITALNTFVDSNAFLSEFEVGCENGIKWINKELYNENVAVFVRESANKKELLYFVINASRDNKDKFSFGVPAAGKFKEVFNTDLLGFGGNGFVNKSAVATDEIPMHGFEQSVALKLAGLSLSVYSFRVFTAKELEQIRLNKRKALIKYIETEKQNIEADRNAAILAINEEADDKINKLDNLLIEFDKRK